MAIGTQPRRHLPLLNLNHKRHHQCDVAHQPWNFRNKYLKSPSLTTPSVATECLTLTNWQISFGSFHVQLVSIKVMTWQRWKQDLLLRWSSHAGHAVMNWTYTTLLVRTSMCDFRWPSTASEAITLMVSGSSPIWTCHLPSVRVDQTTTRTPSMQRQRRLHSRVWQSLPENCLTLCLPTVMQLFLVTVLGSGVGSLVKMV